MKPVVLLINPNTSRETTAMMHRLARAALPEAYALQSETAANGAPMITSDEELAVSIQEVLAIGRRHAADVAAIVIAAFGNPGLETLRQRVAIPVVGIGEASLQEAARGGRRFGVATTTPGLEASITASVDALGLTPCFTGCRIPAVDPLRLAADAGLQDTYLEQAVTSCIVQDGAEAVVIGGGPLAQSAERIGPRFAIPVISPVAAAMRAVASALNQDRRLHPEQALKGSIC
ncbi:aspartate/glutamate racemase family protein [Achromobacter sp. NPDC058515]|uniref:aspartate/glutamate racemase family protein n=1 Tax=Achromobacter sp. NPDC058515 TaxID=3346533 RepID=UPI00364C9E5E